MKEVEGAKSSSSSRKKAFDTNLSNLSSEPRTFAMKSIHDRVSDPEKILSNLKWVIFPSNKWIKRWDMAILVVLFLLLFVLPYQIGVSGGYRILKNIPWLVVNVVINSVLFVDTFLYLFRAYRTKDGTLILNLARIRRHYLQTWFFINLVSALPFTITFYFVGNKLLEKGEAVSSYHSVTLTVIKIGELLRLLRLFRVREIIRSSDAATSFVEQRSSQRLLLWRYIFLIVIVSHWFACIWSFVAFCQTHSFNNEDILDPSKPNWIGSWWEGNEVEGGLNPLGWKQDLDRYAIALFWATQTLTSIGYGSPLPVTTVEYYVACVLQLCAGMMWAYLVGDLVGVVAGMKRAEEVFHTRKDQANDLIGQFKQSQDIQLDRRVIDSEEVAQRIRRYVWNQYKLSKANTYSSNFMQRFPIAETLTPELQWLSSGLLINQHFKAVSYLSDRHLTSEEQCFVAMNCLMLEFPAGETVRLEDSGLGRGIFIFVRGCACTWNPNKHTLKDCFSLVTAGFAFGADKCLVEDGNPASCGTIHFIAFSRVLFVPRTSVLSVLEKNSKAWKESARWHYFTTLLLAAAAVEREADRRVVCRGLSFVERSSSYVPTKDVSYKM